ncbi:CBS domain-containing protein [Bacillus badius]|uniref:CBS domain containing protein n=1 Tax=Bacillus badius TaxID=1455 RepID=A0ABR5AWC1_BACBA|nr:CBS domain-containing protein [Bacillus badius]KIL74573.1 putative CBS domain containing protein [Bacillus badius]KIL79041.1 putative CBS domain containing protein [Bacillus badius]MED4715525.1 CBS domain-containing protein [Bacillus badius]
MEKETKTNNGLSERFETAFNRIHNHLKAITAQKDGDAFLELLHTSARNHASVRAHLDELKQYAKLRNAIVHQKTEANYYIAEPHQEIVERIEQIDKMLSEPAEAMSIASSPVYIVEADTPLIQVLEMVRDFKINEYPVYEKGDCQGLLTGRDILKWMANTQLDGQITIDSVKVKDILPEKNEYLISFAKRDANIFDIEYTFEEYQSQNKKLEAILITHEGRSDELPVGIITSWDLTKNNDVILSP